MINTNRIAVYLLGALVAVCIFANTARATGRLQQITTDADYEKEPSWSPDGTTIACSFGWGQNSDIWTIRLSDGELTRITTDAASDALPSWSPDGRMIAFCSNRGRSWDI